eukprot:5157793-Amphidinium_carterae.1
MRTQPAWAPPAWLAALREEAPRLVVMFSDGLPIARTVTMIRLVDDHVSLVMKYSPNTNYDLMYSKPY